MRYTTWLVVLLAWSFVVSVFAETVQDTEIAFIHVNDLHAHLLPRKNLVLDTEQTNLESPKVVELGGLARLATVVARLRANTQHSVLMNIGDTYHGGAEALYTRGNAVVPPVDALGIDIGVPGNWDFAYGPITTRLRYDPDRSNLSHMVNRVVFESPVEVPSYSLLGGNVRKTLPLLDDGSALLPATRLMAFGKVRVGFIGITSDIIPRMSPMLALGFEFLQGEQAYRDYIDEHAAALRQQGADVVVVMSELGLHKDRQLANAIKPGVDVIFSAHTHELTRKPLHSDSGALVVEGGDDGILGVMTLRLDATNRKTFEWTLLDIGPDIPEDEGVARLVEEARAPFISGDHTFEFPMPASNMQLSESIKQVVGIAPGLLHRRNAVENPFNRFLSDNMRAYAGTDVAITPGFRFDAVLEEGDSVTVEDSYRYMPAPPELATATIKGGAFKNLLEFELNRTFSRDAFDHSGGWLIGLSGLQITLDLSAQYGERVLEIRLKSNGELVDEDQVLTVVSCKRSFDPGDALCGIRGFDQIELLENPEGGPWTAREFLQWTLKEGVDLPKDGPDLTDRSGTELWPQASYIQPIW